MRMRRIAALVVSGAAAVTAAAAPSAAQDEPAPLAVDPTRGPVGTPITVSGEGCIDGDTVGEVTITFVVIETNARGSWLHPGHQPDASGAWSGQVEVAPQGFNATKPGMHAVTATCDIGSGESVVSFDYAEVPFEVTAVPTPTTTPPTTTPSTTVPLPPADPGAPSTPRAPVAVALTVQPTFAG